MLSRAVVESAPGVLMESIKTNSIDGSIVVTLSDGTKVGLTTLKDPPGATAQDIRNVVTALLKMVENLDKRLAALEKKIGEGGTLDAGTLP